MHTVELLFLPDCPHLEGARAQLRRAFAALGMPPRWSETDISRGDAPASTHGFGSPTILVDGCDVAGAAPGDAPACRLYPDSEVRGAPSIEAILAALRAPL